MSETDSDEEDVIKYGTPLDPYEEDERPAKRNYQQPSDQFAVDSYGRRRFHGAFTGGFSAGYGGSVGTPEGWTPASFKSSRSEKASISNQKPEDYMDDEDRGEFGIAPQKLQTREDFTGQKRTRQRYHDGPIPGVPVLEELIKAVHESAAVKILKKMGWREGQGVGNRLRKDEKRRAKEEHKVYGCFMPSSLRMEDEHQSDGDSSGSEFDYNTLFAPDDYEPYILKRKNDRFGLGYSGLSRHSVLGNMIGEYGTEPGSSKSHLLMREKGKKVSIRGQAFGVGAFEVDDEDIYATEDMSCYDFSLGQAEKSKKKGTAPTALNVLRGFVKASKPLPPVPKYPPPSLARDYVPAPAGTRRSRFEPSAHPQRDQGLGRHELTAAARGAMLGETPLPKSDDKDEAPTIKEPTNNTKTVPQKHTTFLPAASETAAEYISIKSSGDTPMVFKPFASDPEKQARYDLYLKSNGQKHSSEQKLCEWERDRESVEFRQAAQLYQPLAGVMRDRFTHASEPDDAINPLKAVAKSSINYGLATPEQIEAAKEGVYGVMTRKETQWRPEALVCKRFNLPELGGARPDTVKQDKPSVSYSIFSYLETPLHDKESFTKEQTKFSGSKSLMEAKPTQQQSDQNVEKAVINTPIHSTSESTASNKRLTVAELFLKESERDRQNTKHVEDTIEKFDKIDLYKAIFLSDSESEDTVSNTNSGEGFIQKPTNVERNTAPNSGLFANIDFNEMNAWKQSDKKTDAKDKDKRETLEAGKDKDKESVNNMKTDNGNVEDEIYGPKIPDHLKQRLIAGASNVTCASGPQNNERHEKHESSSSDSWVCASEINSNSRKKKKVKKHKSKRKKSKHKKKDK